jgi:hypothetical protein
MLDVKKCERLGDDCRLHGIDRAGCGAQVHVIPNSTTETLRPHFQNGAFGLV